MAVGTSDFECEDGVTRTLGYLLGDDGFKYLVRWEDYKYWGGNNKIVTLSYQSHPVGYTERADHDLSWFITPWYEPNSQSFDNRIIPLLYEAGARFTPDAGETYGFLGYYGLFNSNWNIPTPSILPVSITCLQTPGEGEDGNALVVYDRNNQQYGICASINIPGNYYIARCDMNGIAVNEGLGLSKIYASLTEDGAHVSADHDNMNLAAYNAYCLIALGVSKSLFETDWVL